MSFPLSNHRNIIISVFLKFLCTCLSIFILVIILAPNFYSFLDTHFSGLRIWWLIMLSSSLILVAISYATSWQQSGVFIALLLLSISSQLAFTEPKWFQLIILNTSSKFDLLCLLILIIQSIACVIILTKDKVRLQLKSNLLTFGYGKLFLFLVLIFVISISAMPHIGNKDMLSFIKQSLYSTVFFFLNFINLIVVAITLPEKPLITLVNKISSQLSIDGLLNQTRRLDKLLPYIVATWTFIASALMSFYAFERLPHVEDEVAYLFQAKHLLKGMLTVPAPVVPESFEFYLLHVIDGRWFSMTPPGWPLFLALGILVDGAWLVNPLLAGASVLFAHALLIRTCNRSTANIAILFMAVSPWFLAISASLMNHTITLTLMLATWLCIYQSKVKKSILLAFIAGLCAGIIFLTRQLDGVIVGVLTGLWSLHMLNRHKGLVLITAYVMGCIIIGALIFPYNCHITGDPLLSTMNYYINDAWYPGANRLGFGSNIGPPSVWGQLDLYKGHSLFESIVNLQHNSYMLNSDLLGWGIGSLCLVFIHIIWGTWRVFEKYMLTVVAVLVTCYSLYWFSGGFYIGPRYWFIIFFPLVVISVGGLNTLVTVLASNLNNSLVAPKVATIFTVLCVITVIAFIPWRSVTRYYEFRDYHSDFRDLTNSNNLQNSIVFIKKASESDFGSAFILNDPTFNSSEPIFAFDRGRKVNFSLAEYYPEHKLYFAQGRTKEGIKAKLTEGPFTLDSFPTEIKSK